MELPCGQCGRQGSVSNPVFFLWPEDRDTTKERPAGMFGCLVGNVHLLMPMDQVTAIRQKALGQKLGRSCEVRCAACIAGDVSPPERSEHIARKLSDLVAEALRSESISLNEIESVLAPQERKALRDAYHAAREEGLQEVVRRGHGEDYGEDGILRKPIKLRGRRRPPRPHLKRYAKQLDVAVRRLTGRASITARCRRMARLLLLVNPYIDDRFLFRDANDLPESDPRLIERIRKLL